MKVALIDGDLLAFRASSSVQKDIEWEDGLWTCHAFIDDAIAQFRNLLEEIKDSAWNIEGLQFDDFRFAFTDRKNFRYDVLPTYKSNRKGNRKPTCYKAMCDYIVKNYESLTLPNLEGDDVLGIWATEPTDEYRVIISMDKDFKTIPGNFFDFGRLEYYSNSKNDAYYWHIYQTLVGDTTDGYKGCPSYGAVKTKRLLATVSPEEYWKTTVEAFEGQGLTAKDALEQARVARILQYGDYNYDTHEVKLWTPPE